MRAVDWENEEKAFVRANCQRGVQWLMANIASVCGNKRSGPGIQRIAFIMGVSIKRPTKKTKRAPRKPDPLETADDIAMDYVKSLNEIMWR